MSRIYFSLGSNIEPRLDYLNRAAQKIGSGIGKIVSVSNFYESDAWGYTDLNTYLNCVLECDSVLQPKEILSRTQCIEKELGRNSKSSVNEDGTIRYEARTIDIDILFFGDLILETPDLIIPHPRLHLRNFVLKPMCEIAPDFVHPVFGKRISDL